MKKIAVFCIPAHGHTNPILPVAEELVRRGDEVRFYSFEDFRKKIEQTGAVYVSCDAYLPKLQAAEERKLKNVSTTEMSIQDIRITLAMNDFLHAEFESFRPDVVYADSVCFWGKLNAWKHKVPLVVSTSTFAFNQQSSQYMKNSPREIAALVLGLPKIKRELNKLKPYGYPDKSVLALVQSDNDTDSIVYTSRKFQPCAESFSAHYAFVGPSIFCKTAPEKKHDRPLVYIALGTVINERPDFYQKCIDALREEPVDVVISCGKSVDIKAFGMLPEHVRVYASVDQPEVLAKANVFLTHCGMNSVSESLYMATPMVLYPQTNEQRAVARRVREILSAPAYAKAAQDCAGDFRSCGGAAEAADFIESAPHIL